MNKSNAAEIMALLYLIVFTQVHGWFRWLCLALAIENFLASVMWSAIEHRKKSKL